MTTSSTMVLEDWSRESSTVMSRGDMMVLWRDCWSFCYRQHIQYNTSTILGWGSRWTKQRSENEIDFTSSKRCAGPPACDYSTTAV
jgi:hypothetical protein